MGSTPIPGSNSEPLYSIANFLWELKKEGLKETTIVQNYSKVLRNLEKNCNLRNPDTILSYLASKERGLNPSDFLFSISVFMFQSSKIIGRKRNINVLPRIKKRGFMSCLYARVLQVTFNHVLKVSELRFFQPEPFDLPCYVYVDYVYVARHSFMMLSP
jgi:hypothetical protein